MSERICIVDGCDHKAHSRGWCSTHYSRWLKTGSLDLPPKPDPETCPVLDCTEPVYCKGMCIRHGNNVRNYGHAEPVREWPLIARIMHVGWTETDRGCWEWNGKRHQHGYGLLTADRLSLYGARVHRLMWEMHNGPIPDPELIVRHRCDNPPCINPNHLELGTLSDNSADMSERLRGMAYATGRYDGVCRQGRHDVTKPGALKVVRTKGRTPYYTCVECARTRHREYARRKRAS